MGKYFGREPRYSRAEIERQAQEAIDSRVSLGRPPAEDWLPLEARLADVDRAMAAAPAVPEHQPLQIRTVRVSPAMAPASVPVQRPRRPVGARAAD